MIIFGTFMVTKFHTKYLIGRNLFTVFCMSLLLWLTGVNFAVYGWLDKESGNDSYALTLPGDDVPGNNNPAGPDEKTPNGPVSVSEEFLHEHEESNFLLNCGKTLTYNQYQSELCHQHYPVFTPPPNC